ncbi:hypothetical protein [Psychroflexus tropicus]|uniref:hypothetical protein n=1 Tax=Psychroflexus tropicus TaxID=197345 RepID=UPI0003647503|nr:hypothetical protein [Psychroflexus tropicus]
MNFLKQDGKTKLIFQLQRGKSNDSKSGNDDIVLTTAELNYIKKLTNSQGISNYTFELTFDNHQNLDGYTSYFNLVVKELSTGDYYSYIQEFRVKNTWLLSNNLHTNIDQFSGHIVFYNTVGEFLMDIEMDNGNIINYEEAGKCDSGEGQGSGGGGGGGSTGDGLGSGPGPGPGNGSGGGVGSGGTGGSNISVIPIPCNCEPNHLPGQSCSCPAGGPRFEIHIKSYFPDGKTKEILKNGCVEAPEECFNEVGDPCECDSNGDCIEENNEVPIIIIPQTPCQKLNFISQTEDFQEKINELNTLSNASPSEPRYEKGFIMEGMLANTEYTPVEGTEDDPALQDFDLAAGSTISGFMHNHFFIDEMIEEERVQSISIFSDEDVFSLYKIAKGGHIETTNGFTFAMVYQGDMYHLQIGDLQDFIDFGDEWLANPNGSKSKFLYDLMNEPSQGNIQHEASNDQNRDNFARMLKLISSFSPSLSLYHSSVDNPDWKKVVVDQNNNVSLEDCN